MLVIGEVLGTDPQAFATRAPTPRQSADQLRLFKAELVLLENKAGCPAEIRADVGVPVGHAEQMAFRLLVQACSVLDSAANDLAAASVAGMHGRFALASEKVIVAGNEARHGGQLIHSALVSV